MGRESLSISQVLRLDGRLPDPHGRDGDLRLAQLRGYERGRVLGLRTRAYKVYEKTCGNCRTFFHILCTPAFSVPVLVLARIHAAAPGEDRRRGHEDQGAAHPGVALER